MSRRHPVSALLPLLAALLLAAAPPARAASSAPPALAIVADDDPASPPSGAGNEHGKAATADASPVAPGTLELEVGYAPLWNDAAGAAGMSPAGAASTQALTGTATYGVLPDVDVRVAGVFAAISDPAHLHADGSAPKQGSGLGDLRVGARWRFLDATARGLELALLGEAVVPVGTRHSATQIGTSQGFWSGRLGVAGTLDLGRASLNGELACAVPIAGAAGAAGSVVQANVAAGYQLATWAQPELELNYQAAPGSQAHVLAVTAGVVAPWGAGHRVVAAVQRAVWTRSATATTGLVLAFKTAI